jgi:hypothetical protein
VAHVLHLIKDPGNATALAVIRAQAADPAVQLSVVLIHDALGLREPLPGRVYRLHDRSPGAAFPVDPDAISSAGLLDLIFAADSVVTW